VNIPILVIVIPCFNEEEVLPESFCKLQEKITQLISAKRISQNSKLLFVDDGSTDSSWDLIKQYHVKNPSLFCGIKLSENSGHQNALLNGLLFVKDFCDITISIDVDLQDDINVIDFMLEKFNTGCEIVYGVRSNRKTDSFLKSTTALLFYSFMRTLGSNLVYNHADFRLMSKNAVFDLEQYKGNNLFLRGIVPKLQYKSGIIYYNRKKRSAGKSKYSFKKMFKLALNGITLTTGIKLKIKRQPEAIIEKILYVQESIK
jgi:glycosyltransferase involved in cell wall biosynthesis